MTFQEIQGNLFELGFPALAHGCNCIGAMGAGIALDFRRRYPEMYEEYREFCQEGAAFPGDFYPYESADGTMIYNLLTQPMPGPTAQVEFIVTSMAKAVEDCQERGITQLGMPRIGAGLGGLKWQEVSAALEKLVPKSGFYLIAVSLPTPPGVVHQDVVHLSQWDHPLIKVDEWEPSSSGSMQIKKSRLVFDPQEADIITSPIISPGGFGPGGVPPSARHSVMIDLDVPAVLIPSSTPGHSHLYIDVPLEWGDYVRMLHALASVGILEPGYVAASKARRYTSLRLPWVRKVPSLSQVTGVA